MTWWHIGLGLVVLLLMAIENRINAILRLLRERL